MINTIFYYPDSLTFEEYQSKVGTDIAARTIVFADAQKAIYKGGKQFGATSLSDLKDQIQQIFNENPYTLPIASATKLGGIMIGDGFTIDSTTGKLSIDFSRISSGQNGQNGYNGLDGLIKTIFDNITNIRASKDSYGIVKIGNGIDVTDGVISVDFSNVDLSEVEGDITSLKASVALHTNAITDLTSRMSSAEATLTTKASASDVTSLSSRVGTTESTLTDLSAQTTLFARSLTDLTNRMSSAETGLTAKADANNVYTKTQIDGKITTINETISQLSGGAELDLSAITDLESGLAEVRASLAAKANASETYTKTEVDGKISTVETQMTNLGSSSGLSNTAITDLKNRMSSAESSLTSKANASNVYTKTQIDDKFTAVNATLETLGAESGVDTSAITNLTTRVAAAEASLQSKADSSTTYTKTEIDGKVTTINDSISANAGLKSAAEVKSAFAANNEELYTSATSSSTLFAKIKDNADEYYAGIDVAVKKVNVGTAANPVYKIESGISISADLIDFVGKNISISADLVAFGNATLADIFVDPEFSYATIYARLGRGLSGTSWNIAYDDGGSLMLSEHALFIGTYSQEEIMLKGYLGAKNVFIDTTYINNANVYGELWLENDAIFTFNQGSDVTNDPLTNGVVYAGDGTLISNGAVYTPQLRATGITIPPTTGNTNISLTNNAGTLIVTNSSDGSIQLHDILFVDGNDSNTLTYDGTDDALECGASLEVSGAGSFGGALDVNGAVTGTQFKVSTGTNTYASGWSGTVTIDGNTLTFTGGILTAASGSGVTAAS